MAKSHVRLQDIPGLEPARWEILEDRMLLSITVYTAQELPVLNNIQGWQTVSDGRLNNSGDVAETLWSTTTAPSGFYATHACIQYHTGTLLDAGANLFGAAANSTVIAVNNSGHLVGGGDSGFWYWNGSTTEAVQPFEEFPFDPTDTVEDMNDGNAVVGVCTNHQTGYHEAFLWRPGQAAATPVGFLPGGNWSAANAINNNDVIVGYAARGGGGVRAFMAEGVGSLTELPSLGSGPEYTAIASDINDNGLIVGYATEPTAQGLFTDGVVWQNGQIFELPWGPYVEGGNFPLAVNNQNQIVGYNVMGALAWDTIVGVNGTTFTFVKLDDRIVNHDDVPAMRMAVDINDAGQILCSDDAGRLYLLTPFNDTIAPTAAIDLAQPVQTTGGPKYEFTIAYTDNGVLDTSTFDNNDIVVTAPDGVTKLPAKIVKEDAGPGVKGHSYVVTYSITPPGGTWDSADDGTYAISVNGDQVYDLSQNAAA
ncbi:MAG: hypothetical protein NT031_13105, partial [Planctomycetota bacterium]|nr:hypothetical protein [Planctomycetota bacterium]